MPVMVESTPTGPRPSPLRRLLDAGAYLEQRRPRRPDGLGKEVEGVGEDEEAKGLVGPGRVVGAEEDEREGQHDPWQRVPDVRCSLE